MSADKKVSSKKRKQGADDRKYIKKIPVEVFEQFREYFEKPESFPNREFFKWSKKWGTYIIEHQEDFTYLEDDEWAEIRERLIADFERRDDLRLEFEELEIELDEARDSDDEDKKVETQKKWLSFMKCNQFVYGFTDEQIEEMELGIDSYIESVEERKRLQEKLDASKRDYQKHIANVDDYMADYYERTGRRVVLSSLQLKKRIKGN